MHKASNIRPVGKKIDTRRAYIRHGYDEKVLISMLTDVLKNEKWDFPPPLVVECQRKDDVFYIILDGHHRIQTASILASNALGSNDIYSFVVTEADYRSLIDNYFNGIEPDNIGSLRERISTTLGNANLMDDQWSAMKSGFSEKTFLHRPIYIYETHGDKAKLVGDFNLRTNNKGRVGIRVPDRFRRVFEIEEILQSEVHVENNKRILFPLEDARILDIKSSFEIDPIFKRVLIKSKTKGIVFTDRWLGDHISKNIIPDSLDYSNDVFYAKSVLLYMAWTLKAKYKEPQIFRAPMAKIAPAYLIQAAKTLRLDDFIQKGLEEAFRKGQEIGKANRTTKKS